MFGKIFTQIFDSSIAEDYQLRLVFQDMIVLADINGVVDMTPEALSRRTNVPLDLVRQCLVKLEAPDPKSRTPDCNGVRIKRLDEHRDWGWLIVNYEKFRKTANEEQRRETTLARVHKFRGKKDLQECNASVTPCNAGSETVTEGNACNAMQMQRERDKNRELPPSPSEAQKAPNMGRVDRITEKLNGIYGRKLVYFRWPYEDQSHLGRLLKRENLEEEIAILMAFKPRYKFFPHSLSKLLANWDQTLDAARNKDIKSEKQSPALRQLERELKALEKPL